MAAAEEHPWLWLIYLVIAGLPIAVITAFYWPRKVKVNKMNFFHLETS